MPVRLSDNQGSFPEWSDVNHYGINYLKAGCEVELHYHDSNEYWIIISGRGICTTEGDTYEIGHGDMVLTRKGDEHSLIVTEDMAAVYFYGKMESGAVPQHLYRVQQDNYRSGGEQE